MNIRRVLLPELPLLVALLAVPALGQAAGDPFPKACVSCHTVDKAKGADHRLSVALAQWTAGKVVIGFTCNATSLPGAEQLARHTREAFAELERAAHRPAGQAKSGGSAARTRVAA